MHMAEVGTREQVLLDAARAGDEHAYQELVEPHRRELHAHCYRMLGSVHDAEDALQDALLGAWRGLPRFEGRSSVRSWLYRIATNASLTLVDKRPKRVLPIDCRPPSADPHGEPDAPLTETVWLEPYPDETLGVEDGVAGPEARYEQRESVELAFIAALQHLPPRPRAALVLRDVLGFSANEAADLLDTTVAAVTSALQRARKALDERRPAESQQTILRRLGDARTREIVADYSDALERADLDAVVALLAEDAAWSMPPQPEWYRGREAIAAFLVAAPFTVRWRHVPTRANGQLAVGCYAWEADRGAYVGYVLDVLTLRGDRIADVTAFIDRTVFARFGLPEQIAANSNPEGGRTT
jgi:RNA polymerase sigma-70 factor (ECF subfamily)